MQQFAIEILFILYGAIRFLAWVLEFLYRKIVWGTLLLVQNGLACPARFERATYALEEFVVVGMCIYFNGLRH